MLRVLLTINKSVFASQFAPQVNDLVSWVSEIVNVRTHCLGPTDPSGRDAVPAAQRVGADSQLHQRVDVPRRSGYAEYRMRISDARQAPRCSPRAHIAWRRSAKGPLSSRAPRPTTRRSSLSGSTERAGCSRSSIRTRTRARAPTRPRARCARCQSATADASSPLC